MMLRRALVLALVVVYWAGVWLQARRVRHQIGRPANVRPRGRKEQLLWAGWTFVVVGWFAAPFLAGRDRFPGAALFGTLLHPAGLAAGTVLGLASQFATFWCYTALGNAWRMGINRKETTTLVSRGPYAYIRHPIYAFQVTMLLGVLLLLPCPLTVIILVVHAICVSVKVADEEAYLLGAHGPAFRAYQQRTGRLLPRFWRTTVS